MRQRIFKSHRSAPRLPSPLAECVRFEPARVRCKHALEIRSRVSVFAVDAHALSSLPATRLFVCISKRIRNEIIHLFAVRLKCYTNSRSEQRRRRGRSEERESKWECIARAVEPSSIDLWISELRSASGSNANTFSFSDCNASKPFFPDPIMIESKMHNGTSL